MPACACFSKVRCKKICGEGTILNPLEACGECLDQADYFSIFSHGLGATCGAEPEVLDLDSGSGNSDDQVIKPIINPPEPEKCAGTGCG